MKINQILKLNSIMFSDDYDEISLYRISQKVKDLVKDRSITIKKAVDSLVIEECKYFSISSLKEQIKLRNSILQYIRE